jgi:hypothetical protein
VSRSRGLAGALSLRAICESGFHEAEGEAHHGAQTDEDAMNKDEIGSPITLAELTALGEFVRWQDLRKRVANLLAAKRLPNGYPLVASRLPASGMIDLCVDRLWRQVKLLDIERDYLGNRELVYLDGNTKQRAKYDWYGVAPAGHYTEWQGARPESLAAAQLLDDFEPALVQQNHRIHSQSLEKEDWPYLTFQVTSYNKDARWVDREDMWTRSYTVHAADPRAKVEGVTPRKPWFNTTIAVSHRWLHPDHPDPEGKQYREFIALCENLGLHQNQAFLIDYCSLPQAPRTARQAAWFSKNLPGFQSQFKYVTLVLNTGSSDYATRAWCMLELMLAAMSRAPNPTLLNHTQLEEPLSEARQLAESYLKHSVWNQQAMSKAFRQGLTNATFNQWARNPTNVALYNTSRQRRDDIVERFQSKLAVTDPNDRPIIVSLLKRLAFEESDS